MKLFRLLLSCTHTRALPSFATQISVPLHYNIDNDGTLNLAFSHANLDDSSKPLLIVLVGGPGLAAIKPYDWFRKRAAMMGFRVVMYEHRGIGYSRRTAAGHDMPITAARMEFAARDIIAILDHLGVQKAWVLGISYGVFLALQLGVLAPDRIAGLFLDSGFPAARYEHYIRRRNRRLFWNGAYPPLRAIAQWIRKLNKMGRIGDSDIDPLFAVYEWFGPKTLERLLATFEKRPILEYWLLKKISRSILTKNIPYIWELDCVAPILYEETYPVRPDGKPLDRSRTFFNGSPLPPHQGLRPVDFEPQLSNFDWETVLFSGEWDTRTPPEIMARMARRLPRNLHIVFPCTGHEMIRYRTSSVLNIMYATTSGGIDHACHVAQEQLSKSREARVIHIIRAYLNVRLRR